MKARNFPSHEHYPEARLYKCLLMGAQSTLNTLIWTNVYRHFFFTKKLTLKLHPLAASPGVSNGWVVKNNVSCPRAYDPMGCLVPRAREGHNNFDTFIFPSAASFGYMHGSHSILSFKLMCMGLGIAFPFLSFLRLAKVLNLYVSVKGVWKFFTIISSTDSVLSVPFFRISC